MNKNKLRYIYLSITVILMLFVYIVSVNAADTYWWGTTVHALTDTERDTIERVVAAEAQGTSYECILGVTQTIRERSEHWGRSIDKTVLYPQYAKPYEGDVSDDVKSAVADVFDRGIRQFEAYTTHFHTDEILPYWTKNKVKRGEIDNVIFWGIEVDE